MASHNGYMQIKLVQKCWFKVLVFPIVTHSHQATAEMSFMIDTQQVSYHTLYASEQSDLAIALSCQNCIVAHDKGNDTHDQYHGTGHGCHSVWVSFPSSFLSRVFEKTAQHFRAT